jgi:hypothetical protein
VSETPQEGSEGYAEEQPDDVTGDGESRRRKAGEGGEGGDETSDEAARGDEGTATGNPRSAG